MLKRTDYCGEINESFIGKQVTVNAWLGTRRDHGGVIFFDMRDRTGIVQVVFDPEADAALHENAHKLRSEFVLAITGKVRLRPEGTQNKRIPTGMIEVLAEKLEVLNESKTLPFMIEDDAEVSEEIRLQYRYLDLRRPKIQKNLIIRHKVCEITRNYLNNAGFIEVETPMLIKSTPEGARDYLVPSRVNEGKFFALPQSPQTLKQILMVSGLDKYYQIVKCFRDEDLRADRQPEFTQIDIEMSFVGRDDVLSLIEGMMGHVFRETMNVTLPATFRRIAYDDSIELYGTDKPELRFGMEMQNGAFLAGLGSFQAFKDALAAGGAIKALVVPGVAEKYSRKLIEELESTAKIYKAKGLGWMKVAGTADAPTLEGGISKFFEGAASSVCPTLGAKPGDLLLFVADPKAKIACASLGAVRTRLGKDLGLCEEGRFEFAWIVDFPMFEWNEEEGKWDTAHHMFTWPQDKYHATLESDPGSVKGDLYDLVLNGYELASGSIRIHDPELQKKIFKIVGFSEEEGQKKFGFLTEAFKYGAPPHGGIAPGLDRLVMLMAGETSIKEVIAFPKNSFAQSPMDNCPSEVDQKQLDELHLKIVK